MQKQKNSSLWGVVTRIPAYTDFVDEEKFVHSNLLLIKNTMDLFKQTNNTELLQLVIETIVETNNLINEKLKGTALTLTFFQQNKPLIVLLNKYIAYANDFSNKNNTQHISRP